jgi:hypothetical protein
MIFQWVSNDLPIIFRCCCDECPMNVQWYCDDFAMGLRWLFNGVAMILRRFWVGRVRVESGGRESAGSGLQKPCHTHQFMIIGVWPGLEH